jgi:prophage regulatory protein
MSSEMPRLITRKQLRAMVPYTPQHILRLEKQGKFPKRLRIGDNRVAWLLSEVEGWIMTKRDRHVPDEQAG